MIDWEVVPFVSVGPLRFGMSRDAVRAVIGNDFKPFRKTAASVNDTEAYGALGVHLYYGKDDTLEFVETTSPEIVTIRIDGFTLFPSVYGEVAERMKDTGHPVVEDDEGFSIPDLGISIWSPEMTEVLSVGVFDRHYCVH